ncbi:MAG TPA: PDGLE domain-containing protein [Candidatus Limnocylindrales bacterium]|nr:PDGLE domain-containing protein [Candidatus Limnocylindrales bacterium]
MSGPVPDAGIPEEPGVSPGPPADPPQENAPGAPGKGLRGRAWWVVGIAIAVLVVVILAPLASSDPDGLERVAEDTGFIGQAENLVSGLLGDYAIPGIDDPAVSTILSGLLGLALVLGIMFVLGRVLARRRA